jgi:hypothetical protein
MACVACGFVAFAPAGEPATATAPPAAWAEPRQRSRLLHETIHGSLQVMHRDFFREGQPIPSASLEDVFAELEKSAGVKVRWLAVNAKTMNIKNRPKTLFDKVAGEAIAEGNEMFEAAADGVYQYAGAITLGNSCLKCHVPDRTTLEDRKAAVVISMPLDLTAEAGKQSRVAPAPGRVADAPPVRARHGASGP